MRVKNKQINKHRTLYLLPGPRTSVLSVLWELSLARGKPLIRLPKLQIGSVWSWALLKWNHTACALLWLLALAQHCIGGVRSCFSVVSLLTLLSEHTPIHASIPQWWALGIQAISCSKPPPTLLPGHSHMPLGTHVCLPRVSGCARECPSLGHTQDCVPGSEGICVFHFQMFFQTIFRSGCANL